MTSEKDKRRLLSKTDSSSPDACWVWTSTTNQQGVPRFKFQGIMRHAARVALYLLKGERETAFSKETRLVRFCGNRSCINPRHHRAEHEFWGRVSMGHPNGCWHWMGAPNSSGYGSCGRIGAHRHSLEKKLGRPLKKGHVCMHDCDNRICVNPSHLREGTLIDNSQDMVAKGRGLDVLTPSQKREVYERNLRGERQVDLARELGVGQSTISSAVRKVRGTLSLDK